MVKTRIDGSKSGPESIRLEPDSNCVSPSQARRRKQRQRRRRKTSAASAWACRSASRFFDQLGCKSLQPTNDLRLSRVFVFGARWRLTLIAEVFNLFNIANLSGCGGDLLSPGFGQPTNRATQVFGSGGPRAFQL